MSEIVFLWPNICAFIATCTVTADVFPLVEVCGESGHNGTSMEQYKNSSCAESGLEMHKKNNAAKFKIIYGF